MRLGDKGLEVRTLQRLLVGEGYGLSIDGDFGPRTEDAVKDFQKENGLTVDGVVGEKTMSTLLSAGKGSSPISKDPNQLPFRKGTEAWYEEAYRIMEFDKGMEASILNSAKKVLAGKPRYLSVARSLGLGNEIQGKIPFWVVLGCLHNMEASCNFAGVLHNGEHIIGTGQKTKLVPRGRGPFKSWEEAAIDAIKIKGVDRFRDGSVGNIFKVAEAFNGLGYLRNHPNENTPYLWARTSINDGTGKYVEDGKYKDSANADGQVGFAATIKQLEMFGEFKIV